MSERLGATPPLGPRALERQDAMRVDEAALALERAEDVVTKAKGARDDAEDALREAEKDVQVAEEALDDAQIDRSNAED